MPLIIALCKYWRFESFTGSDLLNAVMVTVSTQLPNKLQSQKDNTKTNKMNVLNHSTYMNNQLYFFVIYPLF